MKKWHLGDYLQSQLDEKNWSYKEFARRTGFSDSYINHLIHGRRTTNDNPPKISVDTLITISNTLKVHEMDVLLAYKGELREPSEVNQPSFNFEYEFEKATKGLLNSFNKTQKAKMAKDLVIYLKQILKPLTVAYLETKRKGSQA